MEKDTSPVTLFVYNRPYHTRKVVESLKVNELAGKTDLIVFSDGPRNTSEANKIELVRKYVKSISGFRSVQVVEREVNMGLNNSIKAGITDVIGEYEKIIVVEDDIVTSRYFLKFMNEALDFYENEDKVISISGFLQPIKWQMPEQFMLRYFDCWGWATWKRGWCLFEPENKKLLSELRRKKMDEEFNFNNSLNSKFLNFFNSTKFLEEGNWDTCFYASMCLKKKLCLYPGVSLAKNIGWDGTGTHCGVTREHDTKLSTRPLKLKDIKVEENIQARKHYEEFFKSLGRRSLFDKLVDHISHRLL